MSNKSKTFEEWLEDSGYGEKDFLKHKEYLIPLLNAWNAAIESRKEIEEKLVKERDHYKSKWDLTDALSTKYHAETKRLQSELDKRDAIIQEVLAQEKHDYGMSENDAIHFRMRRVFSILKYDYKELNGVKDE